MTKNNRKRIMLTLKILLTCGILSMLTRNSALNFNLLSTLLKSPYVIIECVALCYMMVLLNTWRWYKLNTAQNIRLSFLNTIMPTYLGIAFNNVLPGSIGGDIVRVYYIIKKFPTQKAAATLSILVDRITGLLGMVVIASFILLINFKLLIHSELAYLYKSMLYLAGSGLTLALCCMLVLNQRWLLALTRKRFNHLTGAFTQLSNAIITYKNAKLTILQSLVSSMFTQFFILGVILIISNLMGLPAVSMSHMMLAIVIAQIANLLPLTPGGIGIGEAAFANVILILNPGTTAAYATVFFAMRLISTLAYLPGVVYGIFRLRMHDKPENTLHPA